MSEYDKLTVLKLREVLVKRGLPKTGLKAALVQRLIEADAQSERRVATPKEPVAEHTPEVTQEDGPMVRDASAPVQALDGVHEEGNTPTANDALLSARPKVEAKEDASSKEKDEITPEAESGALQSSPTREEPEFQIPLEQGLEKCIELISEAISEVSATQQNSQYDIVPENWTPPAVSKESESGLELPAPSQTQSEQTPIQDSLPPQSSQASISREELLEDSRKRKRRSQSPPSSSTDMQKRLKTKKSRPHVELPEDTTIQIAEQEETSDSSNLPDGELRQTMDDHLSGQQKSGEEKKLAGLCTSPSAHKAIGEEFTPTHNGTANEEAPDSKDMIAMARVAKSTESPTKTSPSDTRFKNLFSTPSKHESSSQHPIYSDAEDRVVGPALHPATSALYIRELMRPLKPESIKDHLTALATPPEAPIESSVITEFFLDSIRTHCLVGFANIAAASRVRSGLHDRVWPNERDRRPLLVDFVPEEKLKKWIDVEQNTTSGRGHPSKRWEVVYEGEDGDIKAYLQEVGTTNGGIRAAKAAKAESGPGVQGAPSGPRIREPEARAAQIAQPRADNGKGFQALDELFKSTAAKPKLYYQPVSKVQVDQRLHKLAEARGGGRSDEMRRFSFEDDTIVDKGPEFGNRGRGYGGRGGAVQGSYRARGGAYRGDAYRGGDSWRDRR